MAISGEETILVGDGIGVVDGDGGIGVVDGVEPTAGAGAAGIEGRQREDGLEREGGQMQSGPDESGKTPHAETAQDSGGQQAGNEGDQHQVSLTLPINQINALAPLPYSLIHDIAVTASSFFAHTLSPTANASSSLSTFSNALTALLAKVSLNHLNIQSPSAPIEYYPIFDSNLFTMCLFVLKKGANMPVHDHPGMSVFSRRRNPSRQILPTPLPTSVYPYPQPRLLPSKRPTPLFLFSFIVPTPPSVPFPSSHACPAYRPPRRHFRRCAPSLDIP
ncbi:hypothetical protein M427DRAFT_271099 [Gonapodya prolifera JEL478]|uniref:Uncharacterized protein n=1 Tax=Gonapodya prolifera (strain JEL478) TaxID=1344416 RepID=A0A139AXN1_GONPJ|nr:hypothetical protein M427DRAFT_271099 [Gonapodya prolifera JEL478]|eukprot:KXS21467.1 hypothetical protein M427DRAFT_271099 [Gonapodya prolifera JEL478]